ncbi:MULTISPECIES: crotonase/enoyl-CoA hydratase family protein [Rhodococcus]|uniref:crotonase/enoyl-CoA hydratase family protein n=1 Tax=Rhodococcus TaxID=1827 RepID=UPI001E3AB8B2|nr:crotonase/enoyl-CoA hydratase family protein [Rhodococcus pyridinivorans]MCD2118789.1 crotonase/enoyl-CoA hydratase family protein [Rhodococcus pyridinivorans]MCZ4627699.1 crotonase/enoyl-CoA hydratase family protein [Rhodococcus pyridinivorans]MCZ4648826.1 crotonase/enoyl-CoA hydratase family protein [Rhodococcus pyridinivorans]MDJ0481589.1 crotonase/enoyl-CoA hydratase family protein [Rhodococcus pyridinivorans]MDV7255060.1 crotonase/enoyl-CoA hydratase family protein [Rhodococcus pyridin
MSVVLTEFADGVAVFTLNRPEAKNAVNLEVSEALAAAIDEFEARPDLTIGILTGAGGTFCSGMDLKAFARGERPSIPGRGFGGLTEAPPSKPLIAAVEGWALAGGCELALSADLIVASREAKFGIPEVKRGLAAAAGGLLRLPKILPYPLAMELAITGDPLTAEVAHQHGLVNRVTEPGEALTVAKELAARVAANGPLAVKATKQVVAMAANYTDPDAFVAQRKFIDPVFASADAKEGARAFAEKRAPVWKGE